MKVVGLTGGIGSGKSLIADIFKAIGIPVYNSDDMAKKLMNTLPQIKDKLIVEFGTKVLNQNGNINKVYLAKLVFENKNKLKILNSIVHPEVIKNFLIWANSQKNVAYIMKEAAIIIESQSLKNIDSLILVEADLETRIKRVIQRDNVSVGEVNARIKNQMPDTEKEKFADFIIHNNPDDTVLEQVLSIHKQLIN